MKTCSLFAPQSSSPVVSLERLVNGNCVALVVVAFVVLTEACRPRPAYGEEVPLASAGLGYQVEPYPVKASSSMPSLVPARLIAPASSRADTLGDSAASLASSAPCSPKTIAGTAGIGLYYGQASGAADGGTGGSVFDQWFRSRPYLGLVQTKLWLTAPDRQLMGYSPGYSTGGSLALRIIWRPYEREGS